MSLPVAVAIWAAVVLLAAFAGIRLGYSGSRFAIALGVAAALFAFEFFLAVPKVFGTVQGVRSGKEERLWRRWCRFLRC